MMNANLMIVRRPIMNVETTIGGGAESDLRVQGLTQ